MYRGSRSGTQIVMDRKLRFMAIKTNDIVDCKFLSQVNILRPGLNCPYWHSLNNNATTCALATYTHSFSQPLTQKDNHVSPLPACLPHPYQNISITIVCLSDASVSYTQTSGVRFQHFALRFVCLKNRGFDSVFSSQRQRLGVQWMASYVLTHFNDD